MFMQIAIPVEVVNKACYRWCYQSVENSCLRRLLPGPVTLIFERSPLLPPAFNRGHRTVGIRVPDHHFVRSLITRLGDEPLAQTSANISGQSIGPVSVEVCHYTFCILAEYTHS